MGKSLRDHFLKIDARSLGLFRIAFALVLIIDVFRRYTWARDFYSNEGVLPNHNHLFNLKETGQVWSALHSFSSPDEARFAMAVILVIYVLFLIGWRTRAMHIVSIVCLVSLACRNVLAENAGNFAAIAILVFTAFLPCGRAFSLDSLLRRMEERDEKTDRDLNDRPARSDAAIDASRGPGWSPVGLAPLAVLIQIGIIFYCTARRQSGAAWQDGTALHYALHVTRWVSSVGAAMRTTPEGILSLWSRLFHYSGYLIPALMVIPVAPRITRGIAIWLVLFQGVTLTVLFAFGMYGWTILAIAPLLIPREQWDKWSEPRADRKRTVIYDTDCGVCLWICRLLKRLDARGELTFIGNDRVINAGDDETARKALGIPAEVTAAVVTESVTVLSMDGEMYTRGRAVSEILRSLPLGFIWGNFLRIPGIAQLADLAYDAIAVRRQAISVLMGKEACGIADHPSAHDDAPWTYRHEPSKRAAKEEESSEVPPASRLSRTITMLLRDACVALVLVAAIAQAGKMNPIPRLKQPKVLQSVAAWPRMLQNWDILTEIPDSDEMLVVDAMTRGGKSVDTMTGKDPSLDLAWRKGTHLGQMWNDFVYRVRQKEFVDFQRAFRDYLNRVGPGWETAGNTDNALVGYDAYWVKQRIPSPGSSEQPPPEKEKLWSQARGGRLGGGGTPLPAPPQGSASVPVIRPNLLGPR